MTDISGRTQFSIPSNTSATSRRRSHNDLKIFTHDPNCTLEDVPYDNNTSIHPFRRIGKALSKTTDRVASLFTFKDPTISSLEAYAKSPKAQKLANKKEGIVTKKLPENVTKPYAKTPHELQRIEDLKKAPRLRHRSMGMRLSGSDQSSSTEMTRDW